MIKVVTDCKLTRYDIQDVCKFLIGTLYGHQVVDLNIVENPRLLKRLSNDRLEVNAILTSPLPHVYIMYVKDGFRDIDILCHEIVHLDQYERGDLSISSDYKEITWEGRKYDASLPYDERPWENEAFFKQGALLNAYKKNLKGKPYKRP